MPSMFQVSLHTLATFLGCSSALHFKKVTTSSQSWPYWMEWMWIRRHGPHLSPFLRMVSCQSSSSSQPVPARSSAWTPLSRIISMLPSPFSGFPFQKGKACFHLLSPSYSAWALFAALAWHMHGTCDCSLSGFPTDRRPPGAGVCPAPGCVPSTQASI